MAFLAPYRQARLALNYRRTYRRCYATSVAFWDKHPILLYGLALLFGFSQNLWALFPLSLIALSLKPPRLLLFLTLTLLSTFFIPTTTFTLGLPKEPFEAHLKAHIDNPLAADFLLGIFAGKFDNPFLKQLLGDVGLQHVLAISGFHFSLLALLLGLFIRNLIPQKTALFTLMLSLLAYMIYVGASPSLIRALISIEVLFLSHLLSRPSTSLDRLGLALIIVLLINPANAQSLGCQLSFLATLAILLFYSPLDSLLSHILVRPQTLSEALAMPFHDRCLYILAVFFRRSLALGLAVNCLLFPVLLYYFNQFPPISLLYNLYFPFLVTGSMLLLLIALFLDLFGLGAPIHFLNNLYTTALLHSVTGLPASLKVPFYATLSLGSCIIIVTLLLLLGILLHKRDPQWML